MTDTPEVNVVTLIGEVPAPNTDQMVTLLHNALIDALGGLQQMFPFTSGDAMSACLHIIVDVGLANATAEKLREDIITGVDGMLADHAQQRRAAN